MKIRLTKVARIRIVVGTAAICLGLMNIARPSTSQRFAWLRDILREFGGQHGYTGFLFLLGILFIFWAILESINSDKDDQ